MSRRKRTFKLGEVVTIRGVPVRFDAVKRGRKVTISVDDKLAPRFHEREHDTELTTAADREPETLSDFLDPPGRTTRPNAGGLDP